MIRRPIFHDLTVIRRVGGLEVLPGCAWRNARVIRRVGGLEDPAPVTGDWVPVIRRVGGLEVTVGAFLRLPLT